jgi:hypothetical protein
MTNYIKVMLIEAAGTAAASRKEALTTWQLIKIHCGVSHRWK